MLSLFDASASFLASNMPHSERKASVTFSLPVRLGDTLAAFMIVKSFRHLKERIFGDFQRSAFNWPGLREGLVLLAIDGTIRNLLSHSDTKAAVGTTGRRRFATSRYCYNFNEWTNHDTPKSFDLGRWSASERQVPVLRRSNYR